MLRQIKMTWSTEPGVSVVHVRGEVDAHAARDLRDLAVLAEQVPALVVDLAGVHFVDIAGLDLLEDLVSGPNVRPKHVSAPISRILARTDGVVDAWPALRAVAAR